MGNERIVALEQRTRQLEGFLSEYRDLQDELVRMRKACDGLKQANLKRDMDELKAALFVSPARGDESGGTSNVLDKPQVDMIHQQDMSTNHAFVTRPILKKPSSDVSSFNIHLKNIVLAFV